MPIPPPDSQEKPKILIAEDSEVCMKVLKDQISALGLDSKTDFFVSGDQILEKATKLIQESRDGEAKPIQLMLLDNQMPRKSGQQVIAELRQIIAHQNQTR